MDAKKGRLSFSITNAFFLELDWVNSELTRGSEEHQMAKASMELAIKSLSEELQSLREESGQLSKKRSELFY